MEIIDGFSSTTRTVREKKLSHESFIMITAHKRVLCWHFFGREFFPMENAIKEYFGSVLNRKKLSIQFSTPRRRFPP